MSSQKNKCPYIDCSDCAYPSKDRSDAICGSEYFQECYSYKCLTKCYDEPEEKHNDSTEE